MLIRKDLFEILQLSQGDNSSKIQQSVRLSLKC